jgi:hypothetical protein
LLIREEEMARLKQIGIDVDVNGVIERSRRSFSETENEILRRLLLEHVQKPRPVSIRKVTPDPASIRQRGLWVVDMKNERISAPNLKGAYKVFLLELQKLDSSFLERFSAERSRSRRFVSRQPDRLYMASPELAKDYAQPLGNGWYFDSNLSTQQVSKRIRVAARLCDLTYGKDVRILNGFEEI